jgi:ubiquinone/menaquinone biosynthesis C-methylase UbiE
MRQHWDEEPCGLMYSESGPDRFRKLADYRYNTYALWMRSMMEFDQHPKKRVLDIGCGIGLDSAEFVRGGAFPVGIDISRASLNLCREHILRSPIEASAEDLPFANNSFDVVYSNGVLHHVQNTMRAIREARRVLCPGGRAIMMFYARFSWNYWFHMAFCRGILDEELKYRTMAEILSHHAEEGEIPVTVKTYRAKELRRMFAAFENVRIYKRQLTKGEFPEILRPFVPVDALSRLIGWNLIVKADKRFTD